MICAPSEYSDQPGHSAWRKLGSLATHWAHSAESNQTEWMPSWPESSLGVHVILLVLSCCGSFYHLALRSNDMCAQRRVRSAWASAQSDQSLRCPYEETLCPWLPIERTAKTLIRLGGCTGWSFSFFLHILLHSPSRIMIWTPWSPTWQ